MTKQEIIQWITDYVENSPLNRLSAENAIYPELAGLKFFDAPLVGFSSATDSLYTDTFKKEGVISPDYLTPDDWLPGAQTVISFFLPLSEDVRKSNRTAADIPYENGIPQRASAEWLHARIEGQVFVNALTNDLQELLKKDGYQAIGPTISGKLQMITPYISTWSERHAAFAAGLGTFSLSKGLITKKGMAGRIGSVITDAAYEADERPYSEPFEYCIMCGACQKRCPAGAIQIERGCALGKDQNVCGPYVNGSKLPPHGPNQVVRYGCGKCQAAVPCEFSIPKKKA